MTTEERLNLSYARFDNWRLSTDDRLLAGIFVKAFNKQYRRENPVRLIKFKVSKDYYVDEGLGF